MKASRVMGLNFKSQRAQYPPRGPSGISYFPGYLNDRENHIVDCLLYRDENGELIGILNHFGFDYPPLERKGNVTIIVREDSRRKGIGTALLTVAMTRWPIDLNKQDYTESGLAFAKSFIQPCRCNSSAASHRSEWCPTCGRLRDNQS